MNANCLVKMLAQIFFTDTSVRNQSDKLHGPLFLV